MDIAKRAGVEAPTWCGRTDKPHILESGGTGLAVFDYDGDGDLDLYLVTAWRWEGTRVKERARNVLYRNRGDGTFEDVTAKAGVGDDGFGCGVAVGDHDGDGDPDLFVTNFGPDVLYRNDGDGTFSRVADAPSLDGWSTGAVFFDADGDSDLDLFIAGQIECTVEEVLHAKPTLDWKGTKVMLGPFGLEGEKNRYYENLGKGRFREATKEAGLEDVGLYYSFGVMAVDLDRDLDLDLYVANDSNPNYIYTNDGKGRFKEVGLWSGAALDAQGLAQAGMGLAAGDYDGDGLVDVLVTNFAQDSCTLYRNRGECFFTDVSVAAGIRQPTYAPLSWGAAFADFDLDGDSDLFIANGHIYPQADTTPAAATSYAQRNTLLVNEKARFREVTARSGPGLEVVESSRGVAVGDIDGDGDLDLAIANVDAPPTLLRNETVRKGSWLMVDAPLARRVVVEAQGRRWVAERVIGASYVSASDPRFHFGLGPVARVDRLTVFWPDGTTTVLEGLEANHIHEVAPK
ncbi:MAG: CRTAC1 family protein [Planctomycetota bacterium]